MMRNEEGLATKCRSLHDDNASSSESRGSSPNPRTSLRGPFIGFTLKTSTWVSNSHGLYDYESHNVSAKTYRCHGRNNLYRILRKGVDVSLVTDALGQELIAGDSEVQTIAKLTALEEGGYRIEASRPEEDRSIRALVPGASSLPPENEEEELLREESRFWVVIRSLKDGSIPLRDGDTIKLGRFAFNVKQVVLNADEERKVCSRAVHDEDDVATCETRRSDTALNNQLFAPPGFLEGSTPGSHSTTRAPNHDRALSLFGSGGGSMARDSDYNSYSGDITVQHDILECPEILAQLSSRSSSVNGTTDIASLHTSRELDATSFHPTPPVLTTKVSTGGPVCRICLCEEEDAKEDPLVSPCKCKGSMKWIHLKCLRTWMEGRLNIKTDEVGPTCFFWRPLECELCQESYPTYVDVSHQKNVDSEDHFQRQQSSSSSACGADPISRALRVGAQRTTDANLIELFRIPKPAVPFVILESKHQPSGNVGFHFLSFSTRDSVRLGRGHEADVRVADISVSRLHATLRYQSCPDALLNALRDCSVQPFGSSHERHNSLPTLLRNPLGHIEQPSNVQKPYVYIEDLKSKFGTLVAIDKPIFLYPRMMLSLQVGRTVLTLYIRKPTWSRLIPSCLHLYYKGLFSKYRRKRQSGRESAAHMPVHQRDTDAHDVRLLETYLPMSLVAGHVNNDGGSAAENEQEDGGNALAVTAPLERAMAPV